jgi:hypothetical protein
MIQVKTVTVTIARNPLGFHMLDAFPSARTFHAEHDRDRILTALAPHRPEEGERKLVIHADNARAYVAQRRITLCTENLLWLAVYSPCPADLPPSGFCFSDM